jgi:hypothetical protein
MIKMMKQICLVLMFLTLPGLSLRAQQAAPAPDPVAAAFHAIGAGRLQVAQEWVPHIENPAARRFVQAYIEWKKGDLKGAIQTATKLTVLYPNDTDWLPKTELLCAQLYIELGMLDAADVTARQMELFYEGTDTAAKATALRDRIKNLKAEQASEGSSE